jgi:hypothetical protein
MCHYASYCQESDSLNDDQNAKTHFFEVVDINPEPIGGYQKVFQYIVENMDTSELTELDTLTCEGLSSCQVYLQFLVTETGKAINHKVVKGLGGKYDSLSLNIVKRLPISWKPGIKDDKPVATRVVMPISFSPNSNNDK